jgi:hypothetical protein
VDDAALVQVSDGVDDGTDNLPGLLLRIDHFLSNLIIELSS